MIFKIHTRFFRWITSIVFFLFLSIVCGAAFAGEAKRILLLHSFGPDIKPWSDYARAIRSELNRQSSDRLNIYEHALVTARSSDESSEAAFVRYLKALFSKSQPDLIVSIGAPAAAFVQRHRQELFPAIPMLLTVVDQTRVRFSALTDNDAVVAVDIDYLRAFENIVRVLPDTKSIIVVTGASPIEKYWKNEIQRQVAPVAKQVELKWTDELSFEDLLKLVSHLPPHTAIFWELMVIDATGVPHEEGEALSKLRSVATAPIFSYTDAFFGSDIVGGPHVPILEAGQRTAQVAMRILGGEKASDIKVPPVGMGPPKFDWRQLQRWGISESRLPPNSEIYFREPSAWERYHWQIIAILAAIIIQAALIQGLLYQRRRRHKAEVESLQRMSELAHINRQVIASELSGAIAHEINQPLSAILNNAETGEIILNTDTPNLGELRNILIDIRDDDWRASEIIRRLRSLMSKAAPDFKLLDLSDVVRDATGIISLQTRLQSIEIHSYLTAEKLPILGDPIQLQQVIVNLAMNSIDAVSHCPKVKRDIVVQTARIDDSMAEFSISDSGVGIDPGKLSDVFKPFFTTKETGMGMGLSISQSIITAHRGIIWAENGPTGGAVFRFRLNIPSQVEVSNLK